MKKYKNKIIFAVFALLVLTAAFFAGGAPKKTADEPKEKIAASIGAEEKKKEEPLQKEEKKEDTQEKPKAAEKAEEAKAEPKKEEKLKEEKKEPAAAAEKTAETAPEPKKEVKEQCYLSVQCKTILDNMEKLDPEKKELVPKNGVIYEEKKVSFDEGESVFDLLKREMQSNKIHMEFSFTPMYNSAYIEGIANFYEFDCGELSGWMYRVNGEYPNFGCSLYTLKPGDRVEWIYTCDLGRDIGGGYAAGG